MAQYCWFSQLLKKRGPTYISDGLLTDIEVQRNLDRIVNDIIMGRIDYTQYGNYLLYPVVFDNLLPYCRSKVSALNAELFSLGYVLWACDMGMIHTANTNMYPSQFNDQNPPRVSPYELDISLLQQGYTTISSAMKNSIVIEYRNANAELNKYSILCSALESIQITHNVYELQWVTQSLKQYVRANNNLIY